MEKIRIGKIEISKELFLFLIVSVLMGAVTAIESTSLANRLYEDLQFTVMERSALEVPREFPGLISVVLIGMLNGLGDIRIAAVANIFGGIGLILFGLAGNNFSIVLITLVMYSTGQHIYLPLSNTIAMKFAEGENFGKRLGQVQGLGSLAIIVSTLILFLIYSLVDISYSTVFAFSGCFMTLAGVLFLLMKNDKKETSTEKKFIFRKEFKLYYGLATINGARKQITLTFAPWLLIDIFGRQVTYITGLFFIVCVLNLFFKPWFGRQIDKRGERKALQFEAVIMLIACLGFTFSKSIFPFQIALVVVSICYILDKLMESAVMARATYARKLAREPGEVAKTLSMGISMDHVISMFIPLAAGYAWYANGANGYMWVFIGGLVISVINFILASHIPKKVEANY